MGLVTWEEVNQAKDDHDEVHLIPAIGEISLFAAETHRNDLADALDREVDAEGDIANL